MGNSNALDNLRYLADSVVAGNGDFDHARRIHPSAADHRHCSRVTQSDSGKTAHLKVLAQQRHEVDNGRHQCLRNSRLPGAGELLHSFSG